MNDGRESVAVTVLRKMKADPLDVLAEAACLSRTINDGCIMQSNVNRPLDLNADFENDIRFYHTFYTRANIMVKCNNCLSYCRIKDFSGYPKSKILHIHICKDCEILAMDGGLN